MKYTTFDRKHWNLVSFDTIGYDREKEILIIQLFSGKTIEYKKIDQSLLFEFIIALNKETFIKENIDGHFHCIVTEASISS